MRGNLTLVVASALVFGTGGVYGQTVYTAGTQGIDGNCVPFGCLNVTRYQQVYSSSIFASPLLIDQITFFYGSQEAAQNDTIIVPYTDLNGATHAPPIPQPPLQSATFQFFLSTTSVEVNALAADLNSNVGGDEVSFLTTSALPPTMVKGTTLDFFGTTPFYYDPGLGNLLLDIVVTGLSDPLPNQFDPILTHYLDAEYSGTSFSRAWEDQLGSHGADREIGFGESRVGLVTAFTESGTVVNVVPEPMTIVLLATGLVGIAGAARRRRQQGISEDC